MKDLSPVCRILLETENPSADAALLASLPHLSIDEVPTIVDVLLERGNDAGLTGIVTHFHQFAESVQARVIARADQLHTALRTSLRSTTSQTRLNAVQIICRCESFSVATLLAGVLIDSSARVRELAADALYKLADRFYGYEARELAALSEQTTERRLSSQQTHDTLWTLTHERRRILAALDDAVETFDRHHRIEILEPAMWFIHAMGSVVWPRATRNRSQLGYAMVDALHGNNDPRQAAFALGALQYADLRNPVAKQLAAVQDEPLFTALIDHAWMAIDVRMRNALQHLRGIHWLLDNRARIAEMPELRQRKIVLLVTALGMPADTKIGLLHEMLRNGPPSLRREAFWALVALDTDASTNLLIMVAGWSDDPLAPAARRELRRRGMGRQNADRPRVAADASAAAPRTDNLHPTTNPSPEASLEGFWDNFDSLDEVGRHDLLRRCASRGVNIKSELRKKITSSRPSDQVRAMVTAAQCGLIEAYRTEIYNLAHEPHSLVRATAISMLTMLPGPTTERMLRSALCDEDDRVQANAVEAIDVMAVEDRVELLREKLDADNNRVRANAVHALLKLQIREAAESLLTMLNHPNRAFRLSGLWLADQMRLGALTPRLLKMAREDPDTQVRERAAEIADRLNGPAEEPRPAEESTA